MALDRLADACDHGRVQVLVEKGRAVLEVARQMPRQCDEQGRRDPTPELARPEGSEQPAIDEQRDADRGWADKGRRPLGHEGQPDEGTGALLRQVWHPLGRRGRLRVPVAQRRRGDRLDFGE